MARSLCSSEPSSSDDEQSSPEPVQQHQRATTPRYIQKNRELAARRAEEEESSDENDGYGPSAYNDNPTRSFITYFHEDTSFQDWIFKLVDVIERRDLLEQSLLYNAIALSRDAGPNSFSVSYTVPRKVTSETEVKKAEDFDELVVQAKATDGTKEGARCKVFVTEHKVAVHSAAGEAATSSDESDEDEKTKKKKRKKIELSPEEKTQDEIIAKLTIQHACNARSCSRTPCYVAGPEAEHIHLTHQHLRLWAAAIESKAEGVDMETPPNAKLFNPACSSNTADIAMLAQRRAAAGQPTQQPQTTVSLAGLAEFIREMRQPESTRATEAPAPEALALPQPKRLPPRMKLDDFCRLYGLDDGLKHKLGAIDITGPHVLRLVTDDDLRKSGTLTIGELATLRDAEERWHDDTNWNLN
ncbi:hypothetical protein H1R20_g190, partial [Candolleomyces eurysporus]